MFAGMSDGDMVEDSDVSPRERWRVRWREDGSFELRKASVWLTRSKKKKKTWRKSKSIGVGRWTCDRKLISTVYPVLFAGCGPRQIKKKESI